MNDTLEEVIVRVFDQSRMTTSYIEHQPGVELNVRAIACRICEILATAIGREIGAAFKDDEEMAVKIAARLSYVILGEISEALENAEEN